MGLLFRSFYAFAGRPLKSRDGLPTSALFGLARVLLNMAGREPERLICAFDSPGPTFRHKLDPEYKAHRDEPPEDLILQIPWAETLAKASGIPAVKAPGFEADDLIATLTRISRDQGREVLIVSGDKDLFQLVGPGVRMLNSKGSVSDDVTMDEDAVMAKIGVRPDQVRDFLALTGDASDNVPGVPGIGPKTAAKLLAEQGTFDNLYKNLSRLPEGKLKTNLTEHRDKAEHSKTLVTLRFDAPLPPDKDLDFAGLRWETLDPLLEKLEFISMMKEPKKGKGKIANDKLAPSGQLFDFGDEGQGTKDQGPGTKEPEQQDSGSRHQTAGTRQGVSVGEPPTKTTVVLSDKELKAMAEGFKAGRLSAVDTETNSLDAMSANLVGISVSHEEGKAFYLPLGHPEGNYPSPAAALDRLRGPLGDARVLKAGSNLKYDALVLAQAGCPLAGMAADSYLASFLLDADLGRHGLKALTLERLGIAMTEIVELLGKGRNQITMDQVPVDKAAPYAAADADMVLRLIPGLEKDLASEGLTRVYRELEIPLSPVLVAMEKAGAALDTGNLAALGGELARRLEELTAEVREKAGREFLIDSPKQLAEVLFETLKLPAKRKTKTGYSTDVEVLEELAPLHPVPALVLEYRTLKKIQSTYVEVLPGQVNARTGMVHTDFNQAGAATGRMSSTNPNLMNIPVRTDWGKKVRRAFVPRGKGRRLLSLDYSQIELRILAHLCGDPRLRSAFEKGEDVHAATAAEVFKVPLSRVSPDQRRTAKIVNFGLLYGMGAFRLARETGLGRTEAAELIEKYFSTYAGVRGYFESVAEEARQTGQVRTLFGRRRKLPDIASHNPGIREAAKRAAINTPIQGSAADMMKAAMIRVAGILPRHPEVQMILQVHDELLFDLPADEVAAFTKAARPCMEGALPLSVPVLVDAKAGPNWADMK